MSSQSSLTGNILGTIGAVVGAIYGGPVGAAQGYAIGSSIGNAIDPPKGPTIQGPRLADKSIQVSTYGAMLPRFYGTIGVSGNITWLENNQLKETVRKKKSGGKGGGSTATTKIYTYSATFILSLGIGPIAGVRRIWCGDKLIYNAGSDDLETIIASNQAASGFRIYLGTDDQLPDSRYEADVGVGNATAFRGEAYIAFYDFQLADFANSLQAAQFKVEVVAQGDTLKRKIYDQVKTYQFGTNFLIRPIQRRITTQPGILSFYAYNPSSGTTGGIPNEELVFSVSSQGEFIRYENFPSDVLRPQVSSSAALTIRVGSLGGADVWAPEYANTFPIGSTREIIPRGNLTNPDTINVSGSLGDLTDLLVGESGRYVHGASFSPSGDSLILLTGSVPASSTSQADRYFIISQDAALSDSGTITGSNRVFPLFDNMTLLNGSTVFDPENSILWSSYFDSNQSFTVGYSFNNGVLEQDFIETSSPATGAGYPATCGLDGMLYVLLPYGGELHWRVYQKAHTSIDLIPLSDVVDSEIILSSLLSQSDVDSSLLTDSVRGYKVSGGSIRSALEPLQGAFPFDVIQSGYQLKCVPRGQSSAMSISWEDLVTDGSQDIGEILKESREMDSQLPVRTNVKYLDAAREYAIAEQYSERPNTQAINRVDREFPIVITADEAAKVADVLNNLPWQERTTAQTSLPPTMLALEPSDVITLTTPFAVYEYRIADSKYTASGSIDIQVRANNAAIYTSSAEGSEGVPPVGTIPLAGPTLWVPLDIPVVDETVQNSPGFGSVATGFTSGWNGAVAFRTIDSGQTWSEIQGYTGIPTIGYARTALTANTGHVIEKTSFVIDLLSGELESITRDQMIAGQNYAAYGVDGRWEIIRFQNATLQGDGSYLVSNFVRGDKGTEWATGLHAAGDYFVLLDDPDNAFIDMAVGSIGIDSTYRGVTNGASIDSASDVPFTYQGVNLEPLSPVTANGVRDVSGNFTGSFYRRSRLSSSWWSTGVPAPIGETTESYEIDVMDGSTVKRTITASTPSFSYSAANQVTDFGSAQEAITFRIYQLSEIVGRGYVLEVTL